MKQLVIGERNREAFWFDGKKLEPAGKYFTFKSLYYGKHAIVAIGEDIYYEDDGCYNLLMQDALYYGDIHPVKLPRPQFQQDKGILFFRETEDSEPVRLPMLYAEKFPELLQPESVDKQLFALISPDKATVYRFDENGIPRPFGTADAVSVDGVFWKGHCFLRKQHFVLEETACKLVYQSISYLIFSAAEVTFALFADGRIELFPKFYAVRKSLPADVLETDHRIYHLRDDGIRLIASTTGTITLDKDGTITDSYEISMGGDFPETTSYGEHTYVLVNGSYERE